MGANQDVISNNFPLVRLESTCWRCEASEAFEKRINCASC